MAFWLFFRKIPFPFFFLCLRKNNYALLNFTQILLVPLPFLFQILIKRNKMNNDPMDSFELSSSVRQIIDQQKQFLVELKELDESREQLEMTFQEVREDFYRVGLLFTRTFSSLNFSLTWNSIFLFHNSRFTLCLGRSFYQELVSFWLDFFVPWDLGCFGVPLCKIIGFRGNGVLVSFYISMVPFLVRDFIKFKFSIFVRGFRFSLGVIRFIFYSKTLLIRFPSFRPFSRFINLYCVVRYYSSDFGVGLPVVVFQQVVVL